jgi:glycosyltransferase involved in cell wall biosynthesis
MRVAFYAPMKAPDHPTPSGDRRMAQLLMAALRLGGHEVGLASRLRSGDDATMPGRQANVAGRGRRMADALRRRWRGAAEAPDLWFTYHLYYKAPDWIGPAVAAGLGIPYVVAEASHAPKRAEGRWAAGHAAATAAILRADALITFTDVDAQGLCRLVPRERIVRMAPFLDARPWQRAAEARTPSAVPRLVAVGMMRPGDKLASYRVLADALARLSDRAWHLTVVGDGQARNVIEPLFDPARTSFTGRVDAESLPAILAAADIFVWPAVNEAYGVALLEAQASGLPAVVGRAGGVPEIVRDGETGLIVKAGDSAAFAAALAALLDDPQGRGAMGRAAARTIAAGHDLPAAAAAIDAVLRRVRPP